jgi:mono/diheme cytochrome c family protein
MTPRKRKSKKEKPVPKEKPVFVDESNDAVDVDQIHMRIVSREKEEPEEGFEPTPWWVWTASGLLLFAMGFYLGRYGGSFTTVAHEGDEPLAAIAGTSKTEVGGDLIFAGMCQACHQRTGLGIPGQYPPLAGSEWLLKDPETPIRIVLRGLQGEISVKGSLFNNKMPRFFDRLSNEEIAAVLTHVRSSWGNSASAISVALVDSLRRVTSGQAPWSAVDLERVRSLTEKRSSLVRSRQ